MATTTITTARRIDLAALGFPAAMSWDGAEAKITAEGRSAAQLQAAVDACPLDSTDANRQTNVDGLKASLADMQAIIDGTSTAREKQYARAIRRLLKAQLGDFSTAT